MQIEETYTETFSVKDIYGVSLSELQQSLDPAFEIVDFRPPFGKSDSYINSAVHRFIEHPSPEREYRIPRLIVRRRKQKYLIGEWKIVGDDVKPGTSEIRQNMADCLISEKAYRIEERDA